MEYVVAALETPDQSLESLRLDDCNLRSAALEVLCECHSRKDPTRVNDAGTCCYPLQAVQFAHLRYNISRLDTITSVLREA